MNKIGTQYFRILFLSVVILLAGGNCRAQREGYSVVVYFEGHQITDSLFLLKYRGSHAYRISGQLMKNGKGLFRGEKLLTPGMYAVELKEKGNIAFLISEGASQHFTLSANPARLPLMLRFDRSPENQAFADYQRFMEKTRKDQEALEKRLQNSKNDMDTAKVLNAAYKKLEQERDNKVAAINRQFPGSMLALFVNAVHEGAIPAPDFPMTLANRDNLIRDYYANYTKRHYFDLVDFSDPRITATPLLEQKIDFYFKHAVHPHPDSVRAYVRPLLGKADIHDAVLSQAATFLYELYRGSLLPEHRQVCVDIAEEFILPHRSKFDDNAFVARVEERTRMARLNPVGGKATDLVLQTPEGEKVPLSAVKAPFTILYFFNPGCDACQPVTDRLIRIYKGNKSRGMEVYAVYLNRDRKVWTDYISSKGLDWINVYDPSGTEMVEEKYDIYAMPMIYVLDKDKKVVARDVSVERLPSLLLQRTPLGN
ncbi:MAG: thioredoxin-like domain-containing protein [Prolixibacteraceae bacterium]|jgi:thiol-disulfide isomerase/thioredoxin|nr:redoxin domain-containing protein [Prolixibacteraceae bacterium]MDI9563634.1 thioredoxin-like domain-containing protein [Bacteroidota bacterium]NLS99530.1 redoxin domain-containing protein [Bacteroidales bacterium]OQB79522.1 MAG: Thiol-disulfide oxidoreductase ResA [Bacteroidetes bacterium ADurb.Bin123]HNZ70147.1 thioredoxin-like domain-containing protein [Prolixibacteraceae bacterium]